MKTHMKTLHPFYKVFYYVLYILFGWIVKVIYPLRILGKENLPRGKGFILAPNHLLAIDPMYVLLARGFGKKMLVMSKQELFRINWIVNFFWNIVGAFPVDRGRGDVDVLDIVAKEVNSGRGLLLFPEGTRSKDGNLGRLKNGAFVVAMNAGVDIVPCRISYSQGRPKLFRRISVVFGKPVSLEQLGLVGEQTSKKLRDARHAFSAILEDLYAQYKDRM